MKTWEDLEKSTNFANGEQDTIISSYEIVSQPGSSSSLASIAESLARIENKIGESAGLSRSHYGSQSGSIGSFHSESVLGGGRWSSEPSHFSTFMAPRSNASIFASLLELITQSLLGVRREEPPGAYEYLDSRHDQAPKGHDPCHVAEQHFPLDGCLGTHYEQFTQMFNEGFIQESTKYIDLILLAEAILFKIKLFRKTRSILFSLSDQRAKSEIEALEAQFCAITSEAKALQISSWRKDSILMILAFIWLGFESQIQILKL
jgi:hypothetical protein